MDLWNCCVYIWRAPARFGKRRCAVLLLEHLRFFAISEYVGSSLVDLAFITHAGSHTHDSMQICRRNVGILEGSIVVLCRQNYSNHLKEVVTARSRTLDSVVLRCKVLAQRCERKAFRSCYELVVWLMCLSHISTRRASEQNQMCCPNIRCFMVFLWCFSFFFKGFLAQTIGEAQAVRGHLLEVGRCSSATSAGGVRRVSAEVSGCPTGKPPRKISKNGTPFRAEVCWSMRMFWIFGSFETMFHRFAALVRACQSLARWSQIWTVTVDRSRTRTLRILWEFQAAAKFLWILCVQMLSLQKREVVGKEWEYLDKQIEPFVGQVDIGSSGMGMVQHAKCPTFVCSVSELSIPMFTGWRLTKTLNLSFFSTPDVYNRPSSCSTSGCRKISAPKRRSSTWMACWWTPKGPLVSGLLSCWNRTVSSGLVNFTGRLQAQKNPRDFWFWF